MKSQFVRLDFLSVIFFISLLIFFLGSFWLLKNRFWEIFVPKAGDSVPSKIILVGENKVRVIEAKTRVEITRGLSGRPALLDGEGMLFYFDKPGYYAFWMPKMKFSIDIIWIGESLKVVDITKDVAPSTFPRLFRPSEPAMYVLEVPAGWSSEVEIILGDTVTLENER